jgi:hypothetical protein
MSNCQNLLVWYAARCARLPLRRKRYKNKGRPLNRCPRSSFNAILEKLKIGMVFIISLISLLILRKSTKEQKPKHVIMSLTQEKKNTRVPAPVGPRYQGGPAITVLSTRYACIFLIAFRQCSGR